MSASYHEADHLPRRVRIFIDTTSNWIEANRKEKRCAHRKHTQKNWIWLKCSLMALLTSDLTWRHNAYEFFCWLVKKALCRWINCHFRQFWASFVFCLLAQTHHTHLVQDAHINEWFQAQKKTRQTMELVRRGVEMEDNRRTIDKLIDVNSPFGVFVEHIYLILLRFTADLCDNQIR